MTGAKPSLKECEAQIARADLDLNGVRRQLRCVCVCVCAHYRAGVQSLIHCTSPHLHFVLQGIDLDEWLVFAKPMSRLPPDVFEKTVNNYIRKIGKVKKKLAREERTRLEEEERIRKAKEDEKAKQNAALLIATGMFPSRLQHFPPRSCLTPRPPPPRTRPNPRRLGAAVAGAVAGGQQGRRADGTWGDGRPGRFRRRRRRWRR